MQEEFKDIILKYIYVKRFSWSHPVMREEFQGHLFPGRVYRDIYNPKTGNHKIPIGGSDGLGFETLVGSTDVSEYELVEITIDNILDLELQEGDLDAMIKWMTDDGDIKAMYQPVHQVHKLTQALHNQDEAEALAIGTQAIFDLWSVNPLKFDIVVNLIGYLTEADLNSYEDIANYIRHHPTSGKGVNIAQALRALDNYNSDSRRTGEDLADLYVAVEAIITELERKIENDQID